MAYEPYERDRAYAVGATPAETEASTHRSVAGKVFLWVAWALAAAFWAAVGTTGFKIIQAGNNPALSRGGGEIEGGGLGFLTIDVIGGVIVLGAAIAYGVYRYSSRDRRKDPMTERATRAEYDAIERAGGDDDDIPDVRNSPTSYPANPPASPYSGV